MILVVGSTGLVGGEICRLLAEEGKQFRALVRPTSNQEKVNQLKEMGAELVYGDLKDPESIRKACEGCKTVISTASCTLSRQEGDNIQTVDRQGQLSLVDVAKNEGVEHFIFTSFPELAPEIPLEKAKREVEESIKESGMKYTILQPLNFMEVWLSPAVGFDFPQKQVQVFGSGDRKVSWISFRDVASFAVKSIENNSVYNSILPLGGPASLSANEVVKLFENAMGEKFKVTNIPGESLEEQMKGAEDQIQKSFAGLMFSIAEKDRIVNMEEALKKVPIQMSSIEDYISNVTGTHEA